MIPTKQNIEALIDKLADKSLTFGCRVRTFSPHIYYVTDLKENDTLIDTNVGVLAKETLEILGHPIVIGDVFEKLKCDERYWLGDLDLSIRLKGWGEYVGTHTHKMLLDKWFNCGVTKSLQQIFDEAEWVPEKFAGFNLLVGRPGKSKPLHPTPKQKQIYELFKFLLSLNLK